MTLDDETMPRIRFERAEDAPAVRVVNEPACGRTDEADLVDRLRRACPDALSLVAERDGRIVGHVLFTPVVTDSPRGEIQGMGLAPMAVLPECQRQGIGALLVRQGLELLRDRGCPFVIVLGHPGYYPRLGFVRASRYHLTSQWPEVPDEAFLICVFDEHVLVEATGIIRYREEFYEAR